MAIDSQIEAMLKKQEANTVKIERRCNICKKDIIVTSGYNGGYSGRCEYCGWFQSRDDGEFPARIIYPNMVSYNRAKQLVSEGKPLLPMIDDFIGGFNFYGEMQLDYKGRTFGLIAPDGMVEFYEKNVVGSIQTFATINEFREKAHIDGVLLKDLWHEVENAGYMQG